MSKITASKVRTLLNWQIQLNQSTRTVKEIEIYEDGEKVGSKVNLVLNQKHPMRGFSLKDVLNKN